MSLTIFGHIELAGGDHGRALATVRTALTPDAFEATGLNGRAPTADAGHVKRRDELMS